uniref:Uncharacterized protein n=1 Tax=Arundo donax TaxID=35708 RepID=A0A0A9BDD6_ARUDO
MIQTLEVFQCHIKLQIANMLITNK